MDEGSVGATYSRRSNHTLLLVCGSMNDCDALAAVSSILETPFVCTKSGRPTALPLLGIRIVSAKAYALLESLLPHMKGLKSTEARAALSFFPRSGILPGRHTTDEFLSQVWKEFAIKTLGEWNARRRKRLSGDELANMAKTWLEGRIKRARRSIDSPQ